MVSNRDIAKTAQKETKRTFGFAPALKNIVLLESGDDGATVSSVAFAVDRKGYSWALGTEVERNEAYDL